jgi:hypothetical protein
MPDTLRLTAEPITQGRLSSPTALVELGGDYVFIGSHFGDSMLARVSIPSDASLITEAESSLDVDMAGEGSKASIQVVSTYTNLAPIVDFCVVDTDAGQGPVSLVAFRQRDNLLTTVYNRVTLLLVREVKATVPCA